MEKLTVTFGNKHQDPGVCLPTGRMFMNWYDGFFRSQKLISSFIQYCPPFAAVVVQR